MAFWQTKGDEREEGEAVTMRYPGFLLARVCSQGLV